MITTSAWAVRSPVTSLACTMGTLGSLLLDRVVGRAPEARVEGAGVARAGPHGVLAVGQEHADQLDGHEPLLLELQPARHPVREVAVLRRGVPAREAPGEAREQQPAMLEE